MRKHMPFINKKEYEHKKTFARAYLFKNLIKISIYSFFSSNDGKNREIETTIEIKKSHMEGMLFQIIYSVPTYKYSTTINTPNQCDVLEINSLLSNLDINLQKIPLNRIHFMTHGTKEQEEIFWMFFLNQGVIH